MGVQSAGVSTYLQCFCSVFRCVFSHYFHFASNSALTAISSTIATHSVHQEESSDDEEVDEYQEDCQESVETDLEAAQRESRRPLKSIQKSRRVSSGNRTKSQSHRQGSRKKHKKQAVDLSGSDTDSSRSPLPDSFHRGKENQRINSNSGIMTKTRAQSKNSGTDDGNSEQKASKSQKKLQKKIQDQAAENERLRQELLVAQAKNSQPVCASRGPYKLTAEEKKWKTDVAQATKRFVWGSVKFIYSDVKLIRATGYIFDQWKLKEYQGLDEKAFVEAKKNWLLRNKDLVRVALNDQRNYAQSQLRNYVTNRLMLNQQVPTPAQVLDCATREPYLHQKADKHWIMEMYWDVLLFKVVGKEHWDSWIRHYACISSAKPPEPGAKLFLQVTTEAFLVACYENCFDKWLYIVEEKKKGKEANRKNIRSNTAFIDSDAGQAKWGGWNAAGRNYFKELCAKIKEARERDHVKEMEEACLHRLRVFHKIEERDEKRAARSKRKRRVEVEEEPEDEFDLL